MTDSSAKALPSVATSVIASVVMLGMAPLVRYQGAGPTCRLRNRSGRVMQGAVHGHR